MKTLMLTTAGGAVAALLMAVLESRRDRIRIVGLNSEPAAQPNFKCDVTYLVPPTAERAGWEARVRAIIAAERPDLVLPTRDGDLESLAGLIGDPRCAGPLIYAPGPVSAAIIIDKLASFRFARAHGLPFAETAATREEVERIVARSGFPLIVKPRIGTGGDGIRIVRAWAEVEAHLARTDPVFQPFIGDPSVLDLPAFDPALGMPYVMGHGRRWGLSAVGALLPDRRILYCGTLGLRFDGPTSSLAYRVDDLRMEEMTLALGAALARTDFLGLFNLQAMTATDGSLVPIEYNGRMVGAARSRTMLGISEMPVILHLLLGEELAAMPGPPTPGFTWSVLRTEWVGAADAEALERDGVWRRGGSVAGKGESRGIGP